MKNKERIITVLIASIVAILASAISAYAATSYLYNADEVSYDKTNSELTATDVQGAIDQLYTKATEYTSLTNRVSTIESNLGAFPISLELRTPSNAAHGGYIDFHYNGSTADYTSRIIESASGKLNLAASNGVQINGVDISMEYGTIDGSITSGKTYKDVTITFTKKHTSPRVFLTVQTGTTSNANVPAPVVYSISSTQAVIRIWRSYSSPTNSNPAPAICYLVIG